MLLDAVKNGADVNRKFSLICMTPGAGIWTLEKATPLHQAITMDWYEGCLLYTSRCV